MQKMWKKENLRKNLLRVKQIADQNLGRAEKSEVLSEDLLSVEKRVEQVRSACVNTAKKLDLSIQGSGTDMEKRLKKLPETGIGHTMLESANTLGLDSVLGYVFQLCGECQNGQAKELLNYELEVETTVLNPLNLILENDIPTIVKLRKHLNKLTLDMDSARNRWTTAVRQSQMNSNNMAAAAYKADLIRGELEEAANKVDNAKDALAIEMLNFIAKENDHCEKLVALMTAQANYHKNALETIDRVIPKVKQMIDTNPVKPVYGVCLLDHLKVTGRTIALVIEACVCTLLDTGLEEEGLFRIAGMASKVKKLKASLDAGIVDMEEYEHDLHTVAGAMKQYLRELPEPLLTFHLYGEFVQTVNLPPDQRLAALTATVNKLPKENYANFRYLVKFLAKLANCCDTNKMTASNIAIVIGPNLLWSSDESLPTVLSTNNFSVIIETIINNADYIFPGDIEFHLTAMASAATNNVTLPPTTLSSDASTHHQLSDLPSPSSCHKRSLSGHIPPLHKKSAPVPSSTSTAGTSMSLTTSVIPLSELSTQSAHTSTLNLHRPSADTLGTQSSSSSTLTGSSLPDKLNMVDDDTGFSNGPYQGEGLISNPLECSSTAKTTNTSLDFEPGNAIKTSRSRSVPPALVSKSFHSDVYNTAFALHSLGDGNCSGYMTKVRAMWDDQFLTKQPSASTEGNHSGGLSSEGTVRNGSTPADIDFSVTAVDAADTSNSSTSSVASKNDVMTASTVTNTLTGTSSTLQSVPRSAAKPATSASCHTLPASQPLVTQTGANLELSKKPQNLSTSCIATNFASEVESTPKKPIPAKKPAPPPPPERPHSVAVSSFSQAKMSCMTWPRNTSIAAQTSETSTLDNLATNNPEREKNKMPTTPEKKSEHRRLQPPERPKGPPPVVPSSCHQRSASTGSFGSSTSQCPSTGTLATSMYEPNLDYDTELPPNNAQSALTNATMNDKLPGSSNSSACGNSATFTRHSSTRSSLRPVPPPVHPPVNKVTENTQM
ncbi:SH3 domain-binding protein 1-like isoform X3 [Argonauta hians]